VLATWPDALMPKDQDVRMDQLLWQGQTAAAARQLALTSAAGARCSRRGLRCAPASHRCRPKFGMTTRSAPAIPAIWRTKRSADQFGSAGAARALLAAAQSLQPPRDVDRWFDLLLRNAGRPSPPATIRPRTTSRARSTTPIPWAPISRCVRWASAIPIPISSGLRPDRAQALGRPSDAIGMFVAYTVARDRPRSSRRAFLLGGRAAQAARRSDEATRNLTVAARYGDQFYGQLAAERLGQPLLAPAETVTAADPARRALSFL